jgi:hypothetical protein
LLVTLLVMRTNGPEKTRLRPSTTLLFFRRVSLSQAYFSTHHIYITSNNVTKQQWRFLSSLK